MFCLCCSTAVIDPAVSERDGSRCPRCGSISRDRYMVLGVLTAMGLVSSRPSDTEPVIVGVSDSQSLSDALTRVVGQRYRNHQLHEEPVLDLCDVPEEMYGTADIVTCSEVLEHVPNPVARAFTGLYELLSPGGVAVLSVPHGVGTEHVEHFPPLSASRLAAAGGSVVYSGVDAAGQEQRFHDLVFHGGAGQTLEHRVFSAASFERCLADAGFRNAFPMMRNHPGLGASWEPWSRVWLASKPD